MRVKQTGCDRVEQIFCHECLLFSLTALEGPERLQGSRVCTLSLACISSLYHPSTRMQVCRTHLAATWPTHRFRLCGGGNCAGEWECSYHNLHPVLCRCASRTARLSQPPRSTPSTCSIMTKPGPLLCSCLIVDSRLRTGHHPTTQPDQIDGRVLVHSDWQHLLLTTGCRMTSSQREHTSKVGRGWHASYTLKMA